MADALAANWSGQEETIEAKWLAHARRKFIDIEQSFPFECSRVLDAIAKVYRAEAETEGMSAQERLECHQARSGPVMDELREWIEEEFSERRTEPNSSLGQAFRYVLKHWEGLTRFLTVAGAPLDNNAAVRALKRAVLLRKNALFYSEQDFELRDELNHRCQERMKSAQSRLMETRSRDGRVSVRREPSDRSI